MTERMSLLRVIEVQVLEEDLQLYRVVPERGSEGIESAFCSHYELRRPPRGPEDRATAIHMAVSMFDREEAARDLANRIPKLGGHIARLELQPGHGICVAKTGGPAHWSVWGRPAQLASCIADIGHAGEGP